MPAGLFPSYSLPVEFIPSSSLVNLASGSGLVSSVFDNSLVQATDARVYIRAQTSSTPQVGGTLDLYLFSGVDISTELTDNISVSVVAGTSKSSFPTSRHIVSIPYDQNSNTIYWENSLLDYIGSMPKLWGIGCVNSLGVSLTGTSSNHKFWLSFINYGYA